MKRKLFLVLALLLVIGCAVWAFGDFSKGTKVPYTDFLKELESGNIAKIELYKDRLTYKTGTSDTLFQTDNPNRDGFKEEILLKGIETADHTNEADGLTYTASGINGASVPSWLRCSKFEEELLLAPPHLVILGIGVNDANVAPQRFNAEAFKDNYRLLIQRIRSVSPDCCFLFITNNDCWLNVRGYRRRPNTNTPRVQKAMNELATECGGAVVDAYALMGGMRSSNAWVRAGLQRPDHIHFTKQGYELWGDLLYNALMKPLLKGDNGQQTTDNI